MDLSTVRHRSTSVSGALFSHASPIKNGRGFTLVELMVVIAVMVIVSSVVLVNNGRFGGVVRLTNLAYDVALTIRQAQVYGIAVVRQDSAFSTGYGVHFNIASPSTYVTFKDLVVNGDANGVYDASTELDKTSTMTGGYSIQKLCTTVGVVETCTAGPGGVRKIDIVYIRPEPNARITATGGSCSDNCRGARIVLLSPRGDTMSVVVYANGQISVRKDPL